MSQFKEKSGSVGSAEFEEALFSGTGLIGLADIAAQDINMKFMEGYFEVKINAKSNKQNKSK